MPLPKVTFDKFLEEIETQGNSEYEYISGEYVNKKSKVVLKHKKCGYLWETSRDNFVNRKNRCPKCAKQAKWTKKTLQEKLNKKFNNKIIITDKKLNDNTIIPVKSNITIRNENCGHEYSILVSILLNKDFHNCKICGKYNRNNEYTNILFKNEVNLLTNGEYTVLEDYIDTHTPVLIRHNRCGHEYKVSRTNFLGSPNREGRRCPYCSNNKSSYEYEIIDYIKSFYDKKIIQSSRSILNDNKELDIYLPDLKLAIEFDGLYWHSVEGSNGRCDRNYHLNKTEECEQKDIRLIHIFEDEWNFNKDLIKLKLKHIIGYDKQEKIYARKCIVKEISNSVKNDFLNKNHIQGSDKSIINLGLYYNDKLMSVMTFCKPRKLLGQIENTYDYELSRFANNNSYIVIGSFGKLFSYFKRNYNWNNIITYADRRWSIGGIYENNGFILNNKSQPSYYYIDLNTKRRLHRGNFQKKTLKNKFPEIYNESKSESMIMKEAGYFKIYDCGNLVYVYKK